jgi:hypothetical protein
MGLGQGRCFGVFVVCVGDLVFGISKQATEIGFGV